MNPKWRGNDVQTVIRIFQLTENLKRHFEKILTLLPEVSKFTSLRQPGPCQRMSSCSQTHQEPQTICVSLKSTLNGAENQSNPLSAAALCIITCKTWRCTQNSTTLFLASYVDVEQCVQVLY